MTARLFHNFDFSLLSSNEFKEDSVREALIKPLLNALGYSASSSNRIIRSKTAEHPFVQIGSRKHNIKLIPDYLLEVDGSYAWVLDAKSPGEKITSGEHVQQIYSYAIHPDIRVKLYALCNGREFILFNIEEKAAILHFHLSEIDNYWSTFSDLLSPKIFKESSRDKSKTSRLPKAKNSFDYMAIKPLGEIKDLRKQSAKRHYGVHGYFTKQVWNVVQSYIKNFTQPGDTVLDPFGGSGVTAIEALLLNRKGIHIDINPHSIFLVENLISPVSLTKIAEAYNSIKAQFETNAPTTNAQVTKALEEYS